MAIYTKTGDAGTTALFDGTRVPKNSLRVDTYGTFDELNAQVSVCEKLVVSPDNKHVLHTLQHQLFRLCAEVATPHVENLSESSNLISQQDISDLERLIDDYTKRLPQQHSFILSGNYLSAAELHVARTICRRGERLLISLGSVEPIRDEVRKFINRLSDALYIMARMEDYVQFVETIVERVAERVKNNHAEVLAETNRSLWDMGHTIENGVSYMATRTKLEQIMTKLSQTALDYAQSIGVPIVVSIVDAKGVLMYFHRMSDALLISNDIAQAKAYTAVALKAATHEVHQSAQPDGDLFNIESMVNRKICTFGGGYPIIIDGEIVGGIGISGGTVAEDMDIASHALQSLLTR